MKKILVEIESDNNFHDINYIKEIDESEFKSIEQSISVIDEVQHLMDLYAVLAFNFEDFVEFQAKEVLTIIEHVNPVNHVGENEYKFLKVQINRFTNNYLSSFRMFIDHSNVKIGKRFQKDSIEYQKFISMTNKAYDKNFSYRFAHKLRNFCQHCALPISGFNVTGIENGRSFMFYFEKEYLLNEYDSWGVQVKEDLINGPESFNVNVVLESHFRIATKFSTEIHDLYEDKFLDALNYLNDYTARFRSDKELRIMDEDFDPDSISQITLQKFPFKLIDKFCNGIS
ncbi:MAG: hypothetical protein ABJN61_11725 [Flavobacteriaceae bacterium]|uniref:hypothetical protein n=1 Tax=Nonlabens ulvanivorans TaxID=906888 RepID=UPI0032984D82